MQSHQNDKNDSLFSSLCSSHNTPIAMGILNCTPDSFYEGSRKQTESEIAERACEIIREGGQIIDIGAFSTRPGAQPVSEAEELRRMRYALEVVRRELPDAVLSVDTYRPVVARMATDEFGVQIINDVSEGGLTGITGIELDERLTDGNVPDMFREVARSGACYILMSVQKDISAMIGNFRRELDILHGLGHDKVILDPGFGFGKEVLTGNYDVLRNMNELRKAFPEKPLLAALSRKRMIWMVLGCTAQDESALHGTMLLNLVALQNGASILRVHDVAAAVDTIKIWQQISA